MKASVFRLVLAAFLFFGWLGWLFYLTTTLTHAVVLSRPQLLEADLDVIGRVEKAPNGDDPGDKVAVVEVPWSRDLADKTLKTITVSNLSRLDRKNGWQGPGLYILPLVKHKQEAGSVRYEIASIPRSPGFPPRGEDVTLVRIYPATDDARRQLDNIRNGDWE